MNKLLQLKGTFEQAVSNSRPGSPNLPAGKSLDVSKLEKTQKGFSGIKKDLGAGKYLTGCFDQRIL